MVAGCLAPIEVGATLIAYRDDLEIIDRNTLAGNNQLYGGHNTQRLQKTRLSKGYDLLKLSWFNIKNENFRKNWNTNFLATVTESKYALIRLLSVSDSLEVFYEYCGFSASSSSMLVFVKVFILLNSAISP